MNHILMVDDDKVSLEVMARSLTDKGYNIEKASSLKEACKYLSQSQYSLVVTDMNMPDTEGNKVVVELKKIRPNVEIVVVSAYGSLESAVSCMRSGAIDFLIKPCKPEVLLQVVSKSIDKKKLSQENIILRGLNDMKDKFLALVSHELRTPLTLIYGYLTILQQQRAALSDDQASLVNIVMNSTRQLINIVNNIQTIAQAETGEIKLHIQSIYPRKLLTDVLAEMKASISDRKLNIYLQEGKELEPFGGDPIRMHQAIAELVQNAIRNTEDGGEIVLVAKQQKQEIIMSVKDNGIGIPLEEQAKIFEPFYEVADVQQHSSSSFRFGGGGIGIGLALVKRVVEAHAGKIKLESEKGKGTYVEILMPNNLTSKNSEFGDKIRQI